MIRGIHSVASKMAALRFDGKVAVVTGAGRGETKKVIDGWLAGWVESVWETAYIQLHTRNARVSNKAQALALS